jgi:hypothetical protein
LWAVPVLVSRGTRGKVGETHLKNGGVDGVAASFSRLMYDYDYLLAATTDAPDCTTYTTWAGV